MNSNLTKAAKIIKSGGVVIFPTDTAFGIGCRIDKPEVVSRVFKMRRRPNEKAVPILVSSQKMAEDFAQISPEAKKLIKKYWPGGLTIVVNAKKDKVPSVVRGGGDTIGIRMPKHSSVLNLIRTVGVPIVGCSANFAGENTPYAFSNLDPKLVDLVDFTLSGRCSVKKSSTVVEVLNGKTKVLRNGAVKI